MYPILEFDPARVAHIEPAPWSGVVTYPSTA